MIQQAPKPGFRRLTLAIAAASLATFAIGCGGVQQSDGVQGLPASVELENVLQLIPANVSYAYLMDVDAEDAQRMRDRWQNAAVGPMLAGVVYEETGHELASAEDLAEIGINLEGEFAVYSTTALPVGFVRLAEPAKFDAFLSDYRARNPDRVWSSFPIGGTEFWSAPVDTGTDEVLHIDVGIAGHYAIVRLRSDVAGSFVDDAALEALLLGASGDTLASDERIISLRARADGPLTAIGLVDTGLSRKLLQFAARGVDANQHPACDSTSDALARAMPWHGTIQFRSGDLRRGLHVTQLSEDAAARARTIVSGTPSEAVDAASESPLFFAMNVNLDAALEAMNGDPRLSTECWDLGALAGYFGAMRSQLNPSVRETVRKLTGLVMFDLEDFHMTGFIPRLTGGVAVGGSNPVPLTEAAQGALEEFGAIGSVDDTAPFTTFNYSILGYEVRISQLDDRVVIATAGVPPALFNAMAVGDDTDGGFVEFRMLGAQTAEMIEAAQRSLSGGLPAEAATSFDSVTDAYRSIEWMSYRLSLDGNLLIGTADARMVPGEAE